MLLDLPTLVFVTVFVTALLGGLLLFSWSQNRRVSALGWWSASYLLAAAGSFLLAGRTAIPDILSVTVANAAVIASYGGLWAGCRCFANRVPRWDVLLAGCAAWLAFSLTSPFGSFQARVLFVSAATAFYFLAAAFEMWRTRAEGLASRRPIVILLALHAAAMGSRPPLLYLADATDDATLFTLPWLSGHAFEALIVTVALAFLFLAISKERVELEQRTMAARDPLTGILNRRAFMDEGERRLAEAPDAEGTLLLLDIDHFKRVNDAHGHAAGDAVLVSFCRFVADMLPHGALFARLGGEEFGCLFPGTAFVDGYYTAEYLRNALTFRRFQAGDVALAVTVSVGAATTANAGRDLATLMRSADTALYAAKRTGRNRVVCAPAAGAERSALAA